MIVGYKFLLTYKNAQLWTQLHGSGGAYGNGALHVQDEDDVGDICKALLAKARAELKREGTIRLSNDCRHDQPLKIKKSKPLRIEACEPIRSKV